MNTSAARRALHTSRKLMLVVALAVPTTGFSQIVESPSDQPVEQLLGELQAVESREGPNSRHLIEPLTALGSYWQEQGDHLLAVATTQRALAILRSHYGLYALEQAPLVRQLMNSEEALDNHEMAWGLEQELLALAERHPDDLRTARIFRETGDRRMDVLDRYRAGDWPPEIEFGCYYSEFSVRTQEPTGCRAGSRGTVERNLNREALFYYERSIDIILRNRQLGDRELPSLLRAYLRNSGARVGERKLREILAYQTSNSEPWLTRLDTLVLLADWVLLYSYNRHVREAALQLYERAYELIANQGQDQSLIEQIFATERPVVLPAFLPSPLVTERTPATSGYIDVEFEVTKHGESERVEILDTTRNATRDDRRQLVRLIRQSRFRPRVADGRLADSSRFSLRYYLND